ncbi:MAG: hypothetical protein M3Q39_00435 [Actinomycetota bacterium]|nr:hypothetical protein [Actinomycetota bacterium]
MNKAVNDHVGRPANTRKDWTIEELEDAMTNLDRIGDSVEADVRARVA